MKHNLGRAHQVLSWIILVGCILQFFYAGLAVFGVTDFRLHMLSGDALTVLALVNLGLAFANRPLVKRTALFLVLILIQGGLAQLKVSLPVVAALHPVNGLAVLVVAYTLARAPRPTPVAAAAAREGAGMSIAR